MGISLVNGYEIETREENGSVYITSCRAKYDASPVLNIPQAFDGKKLTGIDRKAFMGLKGLRSVTLPTDLEYVGDWAFSQCRQLKTFIMPSGATIKPLTCGRGIFDGCERIENICIGYDEPDDLSKLSALLVHTLPASYLLRDESYGSIEWFNKYDMALLSYLKQDDMEGYSDRALCGEEDISYDGIGSVDGEMPGETAGYLKEKGKQKALLTFARLMRKVYISKETEEALREYIKSRAKGCDKDYAWTALAEDLSDDIEFAKLYLDVVKPDADMLKDMIESLGLSSTALKALLISHRADAPGTDPFAELML